MDDILRCLACRVEVPVVSLGTRADDGPDLGHNLVVGKLDVLHHVGDKVVDNRRVISVISLPTCLPQDSAEVQQVWSQTQSSSADFFITDRDP